MSIRLSFSGFVANIINPTRVNIVTVLKKLGVPVHNSPSIQVLSVNLLWTFDVSLLETQGDFLNYLESIKLNSKFLPAWHGFKFYPWTENTFTDLNTQ